MPPSVFLDHDQGYCPWSGLLDRRRTSAMKPTDKHTTGPERWRQDLRYSVIVYQNPERGICVELGREVLAGERPFLREVVAQIAFHVFRLSVRAQARHEYLCRSGLGSRQSGGLRCRQPLWVWAFSFEPWYTRLRQGRLIYGGEVASGAQG
ncbi:hypothetical protein Bbelb_020270 [Branchiostoma belcheri]|nr:hypothetical protein Bbelb_020270 [Branchiostoma belcheri]